MATFNDGPWLGSRTVRPTDAQLTKIDNWDRGLGDIGISNLWRHAHYVVLHFSISATINNATVEGIAVPLRVPLKVVGGDVGCESAAGSAATGMFEVDPLGGGSFEDLCEADVDILTDVKTMKPVAITDGKEDRAATDEIRLSITGTGAGAVVGAIGTLHCFRR